MLLPGLLAAVFGMEATGLRSRAAAIYQALETPRVRIQIDTSDLPDRLEGPTKASGWSLSRDGGDRPGGTEILVLRWEDSQGRTIGRRRLPVRLHRHEWTPFARERLERGQRPDSTKLRWAWTESTARTPPSPDPRQLVALRLRTGAGVDQALRMDLWEPVPSVEPGQKLTVISRRAGAVASVEGTAQGTATTGGTVRVLTPFGRKILCRIQPDGSALTLD